MVALSRIFEHTEAKTIICWGVHECLTMPLQDSPILHTEHWQVKGCRGRKLSFYSICEIVVCVWAFAASVEYIHDLQLVSSFLPLWCVYAYLYVCTYNVCMHTHLGVCACVCREHSGLFRDPPPLARSLSTFLQRFVKCLAVDLKGSYLYCYPVLKILYL